MSLLNKKFLYFGQHIKVKCHFKCNMISFEDTGSHIHKYMKSAGSLVGEMRAEGRGREGVDVSVSEVA